MSHHATVEDASDDDSKPSASVKATAAPTSTKKEKAGLATDSHELFPELGGAAPKSAANIAPVWPARANANGKANGASPASVTPKDSAPPSGASTPAHRVAPPNLSIPGQSMEYLLLEPDHILPRAQLKRPLADIVKDFNRKSRAQIRILNQPDNRIRVEATGPKGDATTQSLKDFVGLIGSKQKIALDVPRWARPHIIGKGGSTIKALQEKSGARIHVPKEDGQAPADDDDDDENTIEVVVEGNSQQAAHARNLIYRIMGERGGQVNVPLKGIPAEFYPFIAGPNNSFINSIEQEKGVQIRVPPVQAFSSTPPVVPTPSERPVFAPAVDSFIHLAGERNAVKAAREEIERRAEELRNQLLVEPIHIQSGRHQFIIGERGVSMDQFFEETGCTIVIPNDEDDDIVKIIGYRDQVATGVEKTIGLAMDMQCSNIDISRFHRQAPGGAAAHARNVTRYLHQKRELERLGKAYNVHFNTPFSEDGALPWELYARDGKNIIRAQTEIKALVDGHPPARMATVPVDPFYHHYIRKEVMPQVRQNYGVHLVVPEASEANAPLLLVYEGFSSPASYQVPRSQPSQQDIAEMQKWLQDAQSHVLSLMSQQEAVSSKSIEVPLK
jgi:rRNA processing protein Krr1/Pno1